MDKSNTKVLAQLENTLDLYLVDKAPKLPEKWREVLVRFIPWITLIFLVLSLPLVLAVLGIGAFVMPLAAATGVAGGPAMLGMIVLVISLLMEAVAIPGLFNRKKQGWNLLYWSTLVSFVYNIVTFNIIGGLVGALISLYLLFQIKNYYK